MSPPDWTEISDLFAEALEQPPGDRTRFVLDRCGDRPEVLATVERLLAADQSAGAEFLSGLDPALLAGLGSEPDAPEQVGPWRLLREVGAGGMGKVFLAERADGQFQQRVAIKLLKRGMDSDAVLARFLRERQILAQLDHPHIARLLDGGIAADGRPYFVMELVDGRPITHYCEEHRLTVDQRLTLVRTVCQAVEYAHRNLVIHRDLKPSNILVTAGGEPKLLDFGIAKLLSTTDRDAPATTLTRAGGQLLTPEYAAPEQFRGGPITTSTDVYSMGAVLYELLTGERPFGDHSDLEQRLAQLEAEPPLMSSRVSEPERRRRLAGDLDVIVAQALRAGPERRYPSLEGLREDLRRHQGRLPVSARPDTLRYRASRFIRRHRTAVGSTAVVIMVVLSFAVTASLQAVRIRRQSDLLAVERDRARHEAATARSVTDFLVEVFQVADPQVDGRGDVITARELLDRGAERIETGLAGQPELQATLLGTMGMAYANLQQRQQAEAVMQRSVELWRSDHPAGSPGLAAALQHLAEVRMRIHDYAGAERSLQEALAIQTRIDSTSPARWPLYVDLAASLHGQGKVARARAATDTALILYRTGPPAVEGAELRRLAELMVFTRDWDGMEDAYARLVELESRARGPRSAAVALLYNQWGGGRVTRGDRSGADSLMRLALSIHQELGPRSTATALNLAQLASNALFLGDPARAESLDRGALEIYREQFGDRHPSVAASRAQLAETLRHLGRHDESIAQYRLALAGYRDAGGASLDLIPGAEWRLAVALRDGGRPAESLEPFRRALASFEQRFAPDFLTTALLRREYGTALMALGRAREAEPLLRRAVDVLAKRYGDADARADAPRITLAQALAALGRRAEADSLLQAITTRLADSRGPTDTLTQRARGALEALRRTR